MAHFKVNKTLTPVVNRQNEIKGKKTEGRPEKNEYTYSFKLQKGSGQNSLTYIRSGKLNGVFANSNNGVRGEFRGPEITAESAKDLFTNVLMSINNPLGGDAESLSLSLEISGNNYTGESACDKVVCDGILCDKICDGIVCDQICDGIVCDGIYCDKICDEIF